MRVEVVKWQSHCEQPMYRTVDESGQAEQQHTAVTRHHHRYFLLTPLGNVPAMHGRCLLPPWAHQACVSRHCWCIHASSVPAAAAAAQCASTAPSACAVAGGRSRPQMYWPSSRKERGCMSNFEGALALGSDWQGWKEGCWALHGSCIAEQKCSISWLRGKHPRQRLAGCNSHTEPQGTCQNLQPNSGKQHVGRHLQRQAHPQRVAAGLAWHVRQPAVHGELQASRHDAG